VVDNKSLDLLEFPKIREILAEHTSFSASRHLALNLKPASEPETVSELLRQSAEARHLLSMQPGLSIGEVTDVREIVHTAAKGVIIEPQSLTDIQNTLAGARHLQANLGKLQEQLPSLWATTRQIVELPELEHDIARCIGPRGEILDSASAQLGNLRYEAKTLRQRLLNCLQAIIESPAGRRFIQDPVITEREGRYVILVKEEMRHEARGIIHDVSRSEATVFVEPWAAVELGNDLKEVLIEEKREVERILADLSAKVGVAEEAISHNVALIAELDLALAKARYADKVKAIEPIVMPMDMNVRENATSETCIFKLVDARHPLLRGKVVPLSVEMGCDFSTLIVTGPNTGGKTVALKTIGLLTLMTHAGMPIPASEGSCIPLFDSVFADIGDEQSIEQTLSTFSWHMGNMVRIIENSTECSLVLLDELGTSTDPGEGAALARAILLHFLGQGTMTVATTHFSDLKVFAHTTEGMQNASLDFDPVTLTPTYHLTLGIPGGSNAIAVASQIGLPQEIIAAAREMVGKGSEEMELLLGDLVDEKRTIAAQRRELEKEREDAEKLRGNLEAELQEIRGKEQEILRETRDRLARETAQLEKQIREAASELRKTKSREKIEQARTAVAALRDQIAAQTWQAASEKERVAEEEIIPDTLAPGDSVWLNDMRLWGTVLSLTEDDQQVDVQVGHTRLRLNLEDVGKAGPSEEAVAPEVSVVQKGSGGRKRSLELDLRGKRADAIPIELDRYLNDAFLDSFNQVRIIHGFGTGTVRQIVRDLLASHPLVKSFRYGGKGEGGDGVTVVEL